MAKATPTKRTPKPTGARRTFTITVLEDGSIKWRNGLNYWEVLAVLAHVHSAIQTEMNADKAPPA